MAHAGGRGGWAAVPDGGEQENCLSDTENTPKLEDARAFTKVELRGIRRLADRIRFNLFVTPVTPSTSAWREQQEITLAVIDDRVDLGR